MKISIIGGGSIGLLTGYYLAEHHDVTIYVKRKEQKEKLVQNGIHLYKQHTYTNSHQVNASTLSQFRQSDITLICVKQHSIKHLMNEWDEIIHSHPVIFLQNGMGHVSFMLNSKQSLAGVVEHGAVRMSDYEVNHLGQGQIKLAHVKGTEEIVLTLCRQLNMETFPFLHHPNWELMLKEKLIVNAVINPLTALFNVPNHAIVTNQSIKRLAKKLCEEAAFALQLDESIYWGKITEIAKSTGNNTSSMRADIIEGRPSEIEAISGYIMRLTTRDLPFTTFVYHSILALESREI